MPTRSFPGRLRALRRQKRLTQEKLGKIIDLHYINVGRYERGKSTPNSYMLLCLAKALGVTVDFLVFGSTAKTAESEFHDKELLELFRELHS